MVGETLSHYRVLEEVGAGAMVVVFTHVTNGEGAQVLRPLIFLGGLVAVWLLRAGPGGKKAEA